MSTVVPTTNVTFGPTAIVPAMPIQVKKRKKATITEDQCAVMAQRTQERNVTVEAALDAVCDFASEKAEHLAATCGHQKDYYLRLMFTGGALRMSRRKANPYNAWSHDLAKCHNQDPDATEVTHLLDLQREHRDEYDALTPQEKRALVAVYEEERKSRKSGLRLNQQGRVQDIRQTFKAMQDMFFNLKLRTGCDGFMCLVKNNNEIGLPPMWYFTSPEINHYLSGTIRGWDIETIARFMEAFCIAGCDVMNYLRMNRDRAVWIKKEIADKLNMMLAEITGNPRAAMAYKDYEGKIVLGHGVLLEGWTHDTFATPSCLSMSLEPLRILLEALNSGRCYFRRLTGEELSARQAAYRQKLTDGTITGRKERSDKGEKRKFYRKRATTENDEEGPIQKCARHEESPSHDSDSNSSDE